jgi:hypothetical protein
LRKSPKDIVETTDKEIVSARLNTLVNIFDAAYKDVKGIYLNKYILRHVVESYFLDLGRMKAFHQIDHADQHKRAAFTMLWISKLRPVQIHPDADMTEELLLANEQFALHAGLAHLKINISDISPPCLRNMIYTLHFRQPPPEILASNMYLLECACSGKKP